MARYHINQANGEVGECRAEKTCPFGSLETDHYEDAADARAAYEAQMASGSLPAPVRAKRTLWDKIKGVSEEEAVARALAEAEAQLQALISSKIDELRGEESESWGLYSNSYYKPREEFMKTLITARDYSARREEVLELLAHFDALTVKKKKLEDAARALVDDNRYAFKNTGFVGRYFLAEGGKNMLEPGADKDLFNDLKPHCETLIAAYQPVLDERHSVRKEAERLRDTIIEEAALDGGDRAKLSARTKELVAEALEYTSPAIPQPEELEDRRTWSKARQQAHAELKEREA